MLLVKGTLGAPLGLYAYVHAFLDGSIRPAVQREIGFEELVTSGKGCFGLDCCVSFVIIKC